MDDFTNIAKFTIGGVITVALVGVIAKDGSQLGDFMKGAADALGTFAKGLSSAG